MSKPQNSVADTAEMSGLKDLIYSSPLTETKGGRNTLTVIGGVMIQLAEFDLLPVADIEKVVKGMLAHVEDKLAAAQ